MSQTVLLLKNSYNDQKFYFWENSWNFFLKKIPTKFQKRFFWQSFYRMGRNWYYYLRSLKKVEIWGLQQNYMGVFGKEFHRFQNCFNWQSFSRMIFKHSNGENAQNFSEVLTFFLFPAKTGGFFEKAWFIQKTGAYFKFVLGGVLFFFNLRYLKTKTFRI